MRHLTDRMAVMYMGQIMETGSTDKIFAKPGHPYTKALLSSILEVDPQRGKPQIRLGGEVSSPINADDTCRFAPRCYCRRDECSSADIALRSLGDDHCGSCPYFEK